MAPFRATVAVGFVVMLGWTRPALAESEAKVRDVSVRRDTKRFVVARDFAVSVPVGQLADEAAPMYGPLVRLGFHVNDSVELGVRAAYQRGFDKEVAGVTGSLSAVPIHATSRWFMFGNRAGPYAGVDVGVNVFRQKRTERTSFFDIGADSTWVRPSANVGVGWVWSRSLPIDVRVQLAALDLASGDGPGRALTVGVVGGYSIFF